MSWDNISCSCREGVFASKEEYDEHLNQKPDKVYCKCSQCFNSTHEWNLHWPKCSGTAKTTTESYNKIIEYLKTIGEIELNTPKALIVRIIASINEGGLLEQLHLIDSTPSYSINEGKVIVDFAGTPKKKRFYKPKEKPQKEKGVDKYEASQFWVND